MVGEWTETTLGTIVEFQSGGTPSKDRAEFWDGSIPWVSAKDMKRFRLDDTEDHVTEEGAANGTKVIPEGTVLLLVRGMTLLSDVPICIANRSMAFNQDIKALRPMSVRADFLPYLLMGNTDRLLSLVDLASHGTGRLNSDELKALEILLPPEPEQRAIAHILGTLDDKIELNRRMNETLEAIVRALFKSWFVDFEPIRAKAEGRQPARMDVETAALFPDSFIESELGLLPKGWDIKPVREIIEDLFDGPHATPAEAAEGAVYLGIKNLTGTQIDLTERRYISERDWPQWTKRVVPRPHDIVFTYEATLGAFAIVPVDLRCCLGRRLALVRPKTGQLDYCFLFHTFVSKVFQELLMARANQGSTVNRIPLIDFPKYPVIWPVRQLIDRFHRLAEPLWSRIHQNQAEARNLVAIRDTLLPKLISGELRVKDAERALTDTPV